MNGQLIFRVAESDTGRGLSGVALTANLQDRGAFSRFGSFESDAEGNCAISIPNGSLPTLAITAFSNRHVPRTVRWFVGHGDDLPAEYTLRLERGVTIGGIVQNERGEAVAGSKVTLEQGGFFHPTARESAALHRDGFFVETDAKGAWVCHFAPADLTDVAFTLNHPSYAETRCATAIEGRNYFHDLQLVPIGALLAREAVMVLRTGVPISGSVVDRDGRPVAAAKITLNQQMVGLGLQIVSTDQQGHFLFPHCPVLRVRQSGAFTPRLNLPEFEDRWKARLIVEADGFAPAMDSFAMEHPPSEFQFQLAKAVPLRGRLFDASSQPVAGARVTICWRPQTEPAAPHGFFHTWRACTDASGCFEWRSAAPGDLTGFIWKEGFTSLPIQISADRGELTHTLHKAARLIGTVIDQESRQPITRFRVLPLRPREAEYFEVSGPSEAFFGRDGRFEILVSDPEHCVFRVEADGYEPQTTERRLEAGRLAQADFALNKQTYFEGVVVLGNGQPVAGAQVALQTQMCHFSLIGTKLICNGRRAKIELTDNRGRFAIPKPADNASKQNPRMALDRSVPVPTPKDFRLLLAAHEYGFAEITEDELATAGKITLQSWGRVEGVLRIGDQPGRGQTVQFNHEHDPSLLRWPLIPIYKETDDQGRFEFPHVPPGEYSLSRVLGKSPPGREHTSHATFLTVNPGGVIHITIGGTGWPVIGKVIANVPDRKIDWGYVLQSLHTKRPGPHGAADAPVVRCVHMVEVGRQASVVYPESETAARDFHRFRFQIAPDGSFRIEDVPPGEYEISFVFRLLPESAVEPQPGPHIGHFSMDVVVAREPVDLGTIVVPVP